MRMCTCTQAVSSAGACCSPRREADVPLADCMSDFAMDFAANGRTVGRTRAREMCPRNPSYIYYMLLFLRLIHSKWKSENTAESCGTCSAISFDPWRSPMRGASCQETGRSSEARTRRDLRPTRTSPPALARKAMATRLTRAQRSRDAARRSQPGRRRVRA